MCKERVQITKQISFHLIQFIWSQLRHSSLSFYMGKKKESFKKKNQVWVSVLQNEWNIRALDDIENPFWRVTDNLKYFLLFKYTFQLKYMHMGTLKLESAKPLV